MLLSLPPLLSPGSLPQPCSLPVPTSSSSPLSLSLSSQVTTNSQSCPVSTLQEQAVLRRQQVPCGGLLLGTACWGTGLVLPARSGQPESLPHCDQGLQGGVAGTRPLRFSTPSLHTLALAPPHSPSVLLAAPSQPPTTPGPLQHFTINFTITNLPYNSDLENPDSAKFSTTRRVLTTMVCGPPQGHGSAPAGPINLVGAHGDGQDLTVKPLSSAAGPPSEGKQHWPRFPWM